MTRRGRARHLVTRASDLAVVTNADEGERDALSTLDVAVLSQAAPLSTTFVQQSSSVQRTGIYLIVGFARV